MWHLKTVCCGAKGPFEHLLVRSKKKKEKIKEITTPGLSTNFRGETTVQYVFLILMLGLTAQLSPGFHTELTLELVGRPVYRFISTMLLKVIFIVVKFTSPTELRRPSVILRYKHVI